MATTYTDNNPSAGDGSRTEFRYTFPVIQTEDVKVSLNGVTQATTKYTVDNVSNPTHIDFNNTSIDSSVQESSGAPKTGVRVRVYRETTVGKTDGNEDPKAVFAAGSSIRAIDLNANQEQSLMAIHELQTRPIETEDIQGDAVTGDKIADDQINSEHYVDGSIDTQHIAADQITSALIADDQINSEHYVDGSIDEQHLSNSAITSNKIADNAVTTTEILNGAVTRAKLEADIIDGTKLADNAVDSEHYTDGSIDRVHLEADIIDSTKLADNAVNSEHYVDGSIDRVHLAADIVDGTKIADDSIDSEHIAAGALDNEHYAAGSITSDKLNGATVITSSEQGSATTNDTSFLTSAAADARFFNISSGDTIKDGDTFPDNDTTIATTAAINDRIIDLVDDVGGFVPIANELSFPNANPDVNNGAGTLVSIKALSTAYTPNNSGQFTINQGTVGNSAVIITGAPANNTLAAGFGVIVETTTTLNTYAFHRLVPKATEVTTVAGKATEIGRLGTADAVADMAILGTADVVADLNTLGTADVVADMNMLATSDVISDMNTLAVTSVVNNMDTVATNVANVNLTGGSIANVNTTAGSIANVNTVAGSISNVNTTAGSISNVNTTAGSISNVNTVASNITNVNNFADRYQIASNNPSTDGGGNALAAGDLYFNTSANELKVYNGSSWQAGVTATGNFALTTGNTFTGDNVYNDGVKLKLGTGSDLQLYHTNSHSYIQNYTGEFRILGNQIRLKNKDNDETYVVANDNGAVELYYDNSKKFETLTSGAKWTGNLNSDDNGKIQLGNSQDLKIYHNGNHSFIEDSGTGNLFVKTSKLAVENAVGDESLLSATQDGAVELYYDNSKKLETTSSGLTTTGTILYDGGSDGAIYIRGAGSDIRFTNGSWTGNTTNAKIQQYNDILYIFGGSDGIIFRENGTDRWKIAGDGNFMPNVDSTYNIGSNSVRVANGYFDTLYGDGSNLTGINTDLVSDTSPQLGGNLDCNNFGISLGDSDSIQFGDQGDFRINHNGVNGVIQNETGDLLINPKIGERAIDCEADGSVSLYYDGVKKFETTSTGAKISGGEGVEAILAFEPDEGDNASDKFRFRASDSSGFFLENGSSNETSIKAVYDGTVELCYDNATKLETASSGVIVSGSVFANTGGGQSQLGTHLDLGDNQKVRLGAGDDLQLYHDSSNSVIDNQTGYLVIKSSATEAVYLQGNVVMGQPSGGGEIYFEGNKDGAFEAYYDNSKKFNTNSAGIAVHGDISLGTDGYKIKLGTSEDLQLFHDGTNSFILNQAGTFYIKTKSNQEAARFIPDGAVELDHNGSKKFETTSSGITVQGGVTATGGVVISGELDMMGTQSNKFIDCDLGSNALYIRGCDGTNVNHETLATFSRNGAVTLSYDNATKLATTSGGVNITGALTVNGSALGSFPDCMWSARMSQDQTISNQTETTIAFNTEIIDTASGFDTSTYKYTVPSGKAGKYFIYGRAGISNMDEGKQLNVHIGINGQTGAQSNYNDMGTYNRHESGGHAEQIGEQVSVFVNLAVGDVIDVRLWHNEGNSQNAHNWRGQFFGYRLST